MRFQNVTYIVKFTNSQKPDVVLHGIEALAGFASNDLYSVTGLEGRTLTDAELDAWERLTETAFQDVVLPKGQVNG